MRLFQRVGANDGRSPPRGVLLVMDGEWTLLAAAEDAMSAGAPGAVRRLLAEAAAECLAGGGGPAGWPSRLADRLGERLRRKAAGEPAWVFFAAVAVSAAEVHACTAGDLRVHLVEDGRLTRWTRDHVLANESPEWVRRTYGGVDVQHHRTMATRALGQSGLPPEPVTWLAAGSARSVLVCSSDLHRHRAPESCAAELFAAAAAPGAPEDTGLLVRMDR